MKKNKKMMIISIISFTLLFVLLIVLLKYKDGSKGYTVDEWYKDTASNDTVVTVIGSSTCPHCQEYKPIIEAISKEYNFKLYFFEIDGLTEQESDILLNTYYLESFDDHVPYTFIVKDNKFVIDKIGFASKENTIDFLKENGVIED